MVFMKIVGVIEIIAGILVFVKTVTGAYVVMAWLIAIAIQLLIGGHYFDVAVRDLVMAVGAYTLAQLSKSEQAISQGIAWGKNIHVQRSIFNVQV